jgi:hypothetical protein
VSIVDKLLALNSCQYAVWCHKDVLSASSRLDSSSGVKTSHLFCFIWKSDEIICHTLVNIAFISSDESNSIAFNWRGENTKESEGWVSHSLFANLLVILLWSQLYTFIDMKAYLSIFQYCHCAWTQQESHKDMNRSQDKVFWLKDFLLLNIVGVKVMTFDYNADAAFENTTVNINDHAKDLLSAHKPHFKLLY